MAGPTPRTYSQFERELFCALVKASNYGAVGAVEVSKAAGERGLDLEGKEVWMREAVASLVSQNFIEIFSTPGQETWVTVKGKGLKHAQDICSGNPP